MIYLYLIPFALNANKARIHAYNQGKQVGKVDGIIKTNYQYLYRQRKKCFINYFIRKL